MYFVTRHIFRTLFLLMAVTTSAAALAEDAYIHWSVVVTKTSAIKAGSTYKQLEGSRICISPYSAGEILMRQYLSANDVSYKPVFVKTHQEAYTNLVNDECDATVLPDTFIKRHDGHQQYIRPVITINDRLTDASPQSETFEPTDNWQENPCRAVRQSARV
jgi:hypothetical protein